MMSNRDKVISIIDRIPDCKMVYVLDMMKSIQGLIVSEPEEVEPDAWDIKMLDEAETINDGTTITLEELAKDLNLDV